MMTMIYVLKYQLSLVFVVMCHVMYIPSLPFFSDVSRNGAYLCQVKDSC